MPRRTAQGWVLAPCPHTCSLRSSGSSLGVLGLQGHQKEEEEEAGEDHGPPCSHHAAAAAAAAAATALPAAGVAQHVKAGLCNITALSGHTLCQASRTYARYQ